MAWRRERTTRRTGSEATFEVVAGRLSLYPISYTGAVSVTSAAPEKFTLAGSLLYDARHRCGLTQAELAARAGVVRPLISQYETGKKDPSVSLLARLLDACGMELRMHASVVTDSDRDQYRRDEDVGFDQAKRNAQRARREVVSVRRPTVDEVARMRLAARAGALAG